MNRFKNPMLRKAYNTMIELASDKESELYWKGEQRTGAIHRVAFWNGYNGNLAIYDTQSIAHACLRAGQDYAKSLRFTSETGERHRH